MQFTSSDTTIATVGKYGYITAIKAGETIITAEYEGMKAELKLTVKEDSFTVDKEKEISVGEATNITVTPKGEYKYTSLNPRIATVDSTGKITGVKAGTTSIIVTNTEGERKSVTIRVKAVPQYIVTSKEIKVSEGDSIRLSAYVSPYSADQTLTYTSSDTNIVEITDGKIIGKKKGEATITVKAVNGVTATIKVTVKGAKPFFETTSVKMKKGETKAVKATNATKYESSNTNIAEVTNDGVITAKKAGSVTIWAYNEDGDRVGCSMKVEKAETGLTTGWYTISADGRFLSVKGNAASDDVNVISDTKSDTNAQKFYLQKLRNGTFYIKTGSSIGKRDLTEYPDENVRQLSSNQTWIINKVGDVYEIKNVTTGDYLSEKDGNVLVTDNKEDNFTISATTAPAGEVYYPITFERKWSYISERDLTNNQKDILKQVEAGLKAGTNTTVNGNRYDLNYALSAARNMYLYTEVGKTAYTRGYGVTDYKGVGDQQLTLRYNTFTSSATKDRYAKTTEIESFAQNVAKQIFKEGMTEKEAVEAVNKWMKENVTYSENLYSEYFIVERGKGNCMAISNLAEILLDIAGIDSMHVNSMDHQWNKVKVNDKWYQIDMTWNLSYKTSNPYGMSEKGWSDTHHRVLQQYPGF